ncbi:MAG: fructose-6-phosphate aldolase [Clostridia bacterium]|nr:fructose-6-phosphate aldolase [Clostridia bacterium]
MNELMLDTANLEELEYGLSMWPVSGVTSNPSILKKEGNIDVYERLKMIRCLCTNGRSLHIQVVSSSTEDIIKEAKTIASIIGHDTYIKIPVSENGLPAIKALAKEGVNVTATGIYTTMQGILAVLAGAKYVAIYYNRMEDNCTDADRVIEQIRSFIDESGSDARILAASFKNVAEIVSAFASGAHSATVSYALIKKALSLPSIDSAVDAFKEDFEAIHGEGETMDTIANQ